MPKKSNQKENDLKLKARIEKVLGKEKDFSGYDINVRVVNGRVTLQGIVDTLTEKNHAQKVTEAVEGVSTIDNNMTISTDGAVDDRHVYMEVRQELDGDPRLKGAHIKATLEKGKVTLGGEVVSSAQRKAALEAAAKSMGVKEVIDNIAVAHAEEMDDVDIVNEVSRAFGVEGVAEGKLKVLCKKGAVTLKGEASIKEREKALEVAASIPGVKKVKAHLVDTEKGELSKAARAAVEVKKAFATDDDLNGIPLDIYEEEGHLILEGLVADTSQKRAIDKRLHSLMEEYGQELIAVENKIRLND